eukprot:204057-Lingulodinium_polyedra.AAC.1
MALFENVTALAVPPRGQLTSNLDAVAAALRARCNMALKVWELDPRRDFGGPQVRPRLWMLAVKVGFLEQLGLPEDAAMRRLGETMNTLVGSRTTPLSEVLYNDDDPR